MASRYDSEKPYNADSHRFDGELREPQKNETFRGNFKNMDQDRRQMPPEGNGHNYPYRQQGQAEYENRGGRQDYQEGSRGSYNREHSRGGYRQDDFRDGRSRRDYTGNDHRGSEKYYHSDRQGQNGYQERPSNHRGQGGERRGYAESQDRHYGSAARGGDRSRGDRGRSRGSGGGGNRPSMAYVPENQDHFSEPIPRGDLFSKYQNMKVDMIGDNPPVHMNNFEDAHLSKSVQENVSKSNYKEMTPVQKYAIPAILAQRDLMVCAETGSGKTAAFLLPIISILLDKAICSGPNQRGVISPTVLVIVPTRELAIQVYQEAQRFSYGSHIKPGLYYGGTSTSHQNRVLTNGCHILVATPGRLLDCLHNNRITLRAIKFFVIDEADRMFDAGFLPDVEEICSKFEMPKIGMKQTVMFSATLPGRVQKLADGILRGDYLYVTVGKEGNPAGSIKQVILEVPSFQKMKRIMQILKENNGKKILVFVENKRQTDMIASQVCQEHMQATSIHGSRMQQEREQALFDFKSGKRMILISTGVAARGLDIKNVDHVINYDLPLNDFNEYVHRIGRTGRIGNSGLATSFYDPMTDSCIARRLVSLLSYTEQEVPHFLEKAAEQAIGTLHGPVPGDFGGPNQRPNYQNSPRHRSHDEQLRYGSSNDPFDSYSTQSYPQHQSPPRTGHQTSPHPPAHNSEWD